MYTVNFTSFFLDDAVSRVYYIKRCFFVVKDCIQNKKGKRDV